MIICLINRLIAYPASQSEIKVTLLNPFVKDGDEKTMEVVFPMSIPENRAVFGALNRLDTHFKMDNYEDCRLLCDGQEIIYGTGTVTSVTEKEVKLQILSGKSYLRFKESFDKVYIDDIYYGDLVQRHQQLKSKKPQASNVFDLASDINSHGFIGEPGYYAFLPIHDETNDIHCNIPCYLYSHSFESAGVTVTHNAVQPNLMFVMKKVMERLGYRIKENYFDMEPWNKIYVASAKLTTVLSKALPHWTAYKFLDEFRKLFNATYLFDETSKSVSIIPFGDSGNAGYEFVDPLESFSTSFDEEGLEYLGSSNLEYELSDCERDFDMISQDIMKAFDVKEYNSINDLYAAFDSMTEREKMTTIFHCPVGYFYGITVEENDVIVNYLLKECGWFSPMVRSEGGSTVTLHIVPVAMKPQKARCITAYLNDPLVSGASGNGYFIIGNQQYEFDSLEANIACEYSVNESGNIYDEETNGANSLSYVTVQDVMENGESLPDRSDEDENMEIFFASGVKLYAAELEKVETDWLVKYTLKSAHHPIAFTDYREAAAVLSVPKWSLGLNPIEGLTSIGRYHNQGVKIRQNINGNNEVCIKFLYDGKPDPRKLYVIKNRKYVCSRIEMAIGNDGISRLKTGYFYEML